jgi:hypothetical protein
MPQLTITKQAKEMRLTNIEMIDESNATVHSSVRIADEESLQRIRKEQHVVSAHAGSTEYDLAIEAADHHIVEAMAEAIATCAKKHGITKVYVEGLDTMVLANAIVDEIWYKCEEELADIRHRRSLLREIREDAQHELDEVECEEYQLDIEIHTLKAELKRAEEEIEKLRSIKNELREGLEEIDRTERILKEKQRNIKKKKKSVRSGPVTYSALITTD